MTKILSVNPTGYFSYGKNNTISIDNIGLILLNGVNKDRGGCDNGSGKTSLFNAISQILFNSNPSHCKVDETVIDTAPHGAFGIVNFISNDEQLYRVISVRKWRKTDKPPDEIDPNTSEVIKTGGSYSGTDIFLERFDNGMWRDCRATNEAGAGRLDTHATYKKIESILGCDYEQFINTTYLSFKGGLKFTSGTHKSRLEVLTDICNLGKWDRRVLVLKKDIQDKSNKLSLCTNTISNYSGIIDHIKSNTNKDELNKQIEELNCNKMMVELTISNLMGELVEHSELVEELEMKRDTLVNNIKNVQIEKEKLNVESTARSKLYYEDCSKVKNVPIPMELHILSNNIGELRGILIGKNNDLEQMVQGAGKCPRCRTLVSSDHIERERALIAAGIRETEEELKKKSEEYDKKKAEIDAEIMLKLNILEAAFSEYELQHSIKINTHNHTLNNIQHDLSKIQSDISAAELKKRQCEVSIRTHENSKIDIIGQINSINKSIEIIDKEIKKYEEIMKLYNAAIEEEKRLNTELKYLNIVLKLFGDKGIKAYKLEYALDRLNQLVQQYLDIIADGYVQVHVTPYRRTNDGTLVPDIQIVVKEGPKTNVPFELYSGAESQQIVLAFIGAFWQLAYENGTGMNLLCLDEIFGPIDSYNTTMVFNFLNYIRSKGSSTIIVITHNQDIKNKIDFDQVWTVSKQNGISKLEV